MNKVPLLWKTLFNLNTFTAHYFSGVFFCLNNRNAAITHALFGTDNRAFIWNIKY